MWDYGVCGQWSFNKIEDFDERVWLTCCAPPRTQHVSISIRWTRFSARSLHGKCRSSGEGMVVRKSLPGRGSSRLLLLSYENQWTDTTMGSCMTSLDPSLCPNLLHEFNIRSLLRSFGPLASCEQDSKLMELKVKKIKAVVSSAYFVFIFRFRGEHVTVTAFVRVWYTSATGRGL